MFSSISWTFLPTNRRELSVLLFKIVLMVGDDRFMSAEDMNTRFALVVGMCLSCMSALLGQSLSQANIDGRKCNYSGERIGDIPVRRCFSSLTSQKGIRYQGCFGAESILQDSGYHSSTPARYYWTRSFLIDRSCTAPFGGLQSVLKKSHANSLASNIERFPRFTRIGVERY